MTSEQERTENFADEEIEYEQNNESSISQGGNQNMEEYEEDTLPEDDIFSRLGDSSENSEKKLKFSEYLSLIKEIEIQNQMIDDIKCQINDLCANTCRTRSETKDIKRLRTCMEQEIIKLHLMRVEAIKLQNIGSRRHYLDLRLATNLDEDNMKFYTDSPQQMPVLCKKKKLSSNKLTCFPNSKHNRNYGSVKMISSDDKNLLKGIAAAILLDKKQLQKTDCCFKNKVDECEAEAFNKNSYLSNSETKTLKFGSQKQSLPCEGTFSESNRSLLSLKLMCEKNNKKPSDQIEKLKENYFYLLSEYAKKDCSLKRMQKRLKGALKMSQRDNGQLKHKKSINSHPEFQLLQAQIAELMEEEVEFKCIIKEQFAQLNDFRNRYLQAQQKVEEQNVILVRLNMTNKKIHFQINEEMNEVRKEFQKKLTDLLGYPKLLENEQIKLSQTFKDKQTLQGKLLVICKELKSLKSKHSTFKDENFRSKLFKCQSELTQLKSQLLQLEQQRDLYCCELQKSKNDLETLKIESAKIIARTKERTDLIKNNQQKHINCLEKELVQSRATAALSLNDREVVIHEMQGQLNVLCYNFDSAQKQIKSLRNHIVYVSHEANKF